MMVVDAYDHGVASEELHCVQPAIWPETNVSTHVLPYLTLSGAAGFSFETRGVDFAVGGKICVNTYFNLFNLGKWRKHCGDMPITLRLEGSGRFQVTVFMASQNQFMGKHNHQLYHLNQSEQFLVDRTQFADRIFSDTIVLDGVKDIFLPTDNADDRSILFFELTALCDSRIDDFAWATTTPLRQVPDLVLSVTTFKRENEVLETIRRFRDFRSKSPMRDSIRMLVIDNGQSVEAETGNGVTLYPNENLGGAGGFTRGLLEATEANATHCLFMDDDASIHMGSITRTWMMLAYALDTRLAIAGAMLDADRRWQIWENGATFDRGCKPMYFGCDMRNPDEVFNMEFETTASAPLDFYGGWWYFAFPIQHATYLAFPFFVRGDDVSFSLANDFEIITIPGVASIQESFVDKASPTTWYLDMRSHLAHHLSLPEKSVGWIGLQRMLLSFYLRTALRFHYDSLSAINLAIEDVLRGPSFFADNADMSQRRIDLKAMTTTEAWQPDSNVPRPQLGKSKRIRRALLLLTLNGHLMPFGKTLGSTLVVDAVRRDDFRQIYGAKRITFVNSKRNACYTVQLDRRRFFGESVRFLRNNFKLLFNYQKLEALWQSNYQKFTGIDFWKRKLGI